MWIDEEGVDQVINASKQPQFFKLKLWVASTPSGRTSFCCSIPGARAFANMLNEKINNASNTSRLLISFSNFTIFKG